MNTTTNISFIVIVISMNIRTNIHIHTNLYVYIYIYIKVYSLLEGYWAVSCQPEEQQISAAAVSPNVCAKQRLTYQIRQLYAFFCLAYWVVF